MNNPFDSLMPRAAQLGELHGIGSKIKKSLDKVRRKIAKVRNKIHEAHDKLPGGKITGKIRDKITGSKAGKAVTAAVAGYFGGPMAAQGAMNILNYSEMLKAEEKLKKENKAFLRTPEGQEFLATKERFDKLIKEMKSSPEYLEIYNNLKAAGYTDEQIAVAFQNSKPVEMVQKAATADALYPITLNAAHAMGVPYADEYAAEASMQIANDEINKRKSNWLPIVLGIGSVLILGS